ncbi:hypothetical protein VTI74DRAFT_2614 [Chaetomium olivicolor]
MSFFKKLADGLSDDLKNLGISSDNKDGSPAPATREGGQGHYPPPQQYPAPGGYQGYGQPSPQPYAGQHQSPPPQPAQGYYPPPQQAPYSAPPPQQSDYSSPPPQDRGYAYPPESGPRPPPPYTPPADKPPIPAGWTPRWDDHYQRWYYVEEATGRSQWEAPGFDHSAYRANPGGDETRGSGSTPGGYPPYGGPSPYGAHPTSYGGSGYNSQSGAYDEFRSNNKEKRSGKGGMLLAGAGGLAVGAIAGAVIAHELTEDSSDSDSEHGAHHATAAAAAAPVAAAAAAAPVAAAPVVYETNNYYYMSPPPPQDDYSAPPPGVIPMYNARGEEIDSSDRESLRSARDRYEEAMEAAADSSASSSDIEELEEAREEYEEEYEEAYYDD